MAAYIQQLEAAIKETPTLHPSEAYTMQEKEQVRRQDHWMTKHADVLARATGCVSPAREREVARQEAVGKVRIIASRVRIMNQRHALGDPEAIAIDAPTAIELIERELQRL